MNIMPSVTNGTYTDCCYAELVMLSVVLTIVIMRNATVFFAYVNAAQITFKKS
jgi:hypothetical protein